MEERQRLGRLVARCVAHRSRALLAATLSGWQSVADGRRAFRERLTAMGKRADAELAHRAFTGWLDAHAAQQQQQVRLMQCTHMLPIEA